MSALTTRQKEILRWMAEGKTEDEISSIVGIASQTVTQHMSNIRAKLDLHSKALLVRYAVGIGLVQPITDEDRQQTCTVPAKPLVDSRI